MHKVVAGLMLVAALSMLPSCRDDGRAEGVLRLADSLMEHRPDSSLALLRRDSLLFAGASKAVRMAYIVSITEAEDKLYVPHRSDSAMLRAAEYFSSRGPELQRVRSWYLLGRVYCDMLLYGHALAAFDKALDGEATVDSAVCRYKARASTWAGAIYEEKELHADALRYNKQAYEYARRADVPSVEVYALRDIGRSYSDMDKNKEAIPYYKRAANIAKSMNDAYLYNMVMEELAGVYTDANMPDEANEALLTSFVRRDDEDLAAHYFTLADYFLLDGQLDSAIYYNKRGIAYGTKMMKKYAFLDLARLYGKVDDNVEAIVCYEKYSEYVDSLKHDETVQYDDLLSRMEQMFDVERQNVALIDAKLHQTIVLSVVILAVTVAAFFVIRLFNKRKTAFKEQQYRIDLYWRRQRARDLQNIQANEEKIANLENELSSSSKTLTEIRKKLIETEAEMLQRRNEQIRFEHKHRDLLVADLAETETYKLFHDPTASPTLVDYHKLSAALNKAYNSFTFRLRDLYPDINETEVWICCMIKAGLSAKEICNISAYTFSSLSMAKSRLYAKMLNKKGTAKELDAFVRDF